MEKIFLTTNLEGKLFEFVIHFAFQKQNPMADGSISSHQRF